MNIEKIKELREAVADGRFEFDMESIKMASCETPGCIAGTALALWPQDVGNFGDEGEILGWTDDALATFLDMGVREEYYMVYPNTHQFRDIAEICPYISEKLFYRRLTRPVAVRMLDILLATGKVNWPKAYLDEQESKYK